MEITTSSDTDKVGEEATAISSRFLSILKSPPTKKPRTPPDDPQQYRDLMEALGVAVYTTDAAGVITGVGRNHAWSKNGEPGKQAERDSTARSDQANSPS